ncbi:MAG: TetR/AcrR family transcriptional regulator [Gammaproteobacteria bacterium]
MSARTDPSPRKSSRREHLLITASDLFARHGYHSTGIDRILSESGVAKMTLYKYFASKDELIAESIRFRGARSRAWFIDEIEALACAPEDRLVALFDVLSIWFAHASFTGCPFVNATAEYGAADDPIHVAAAEHKSLLRNYFVAQADAAGFCDPNAIADQMMILMEGAIVTRQVSGRTQGAEQAKQLFNVVLAGAARTEPELA